LKEGDGLAGVEALVVPVAAAVSSPSRASMYTVRKGETLVTIADRFGVSLDQLRRWNNISGIKVEAGRRLHVTETASATHTRRGHGRGTHAQSEERSSAKAHESSTEKESSKKSSTSSSKKSKGSTSKKENSTVSAKSHAESPKAASGAKKSESGSAKKRSATEAPAKKKSSSRK
jgi:membrane-bound lytic murein transglycosylase D